MLTQVLVRFPSGAPKHLPAHADAGSERMGAVLAGDKAFVPARDVKGARSTLSWLCWTAVHAAVTQAEAAGVWAPAGVTAISNPVTSANAAPSRQAGALSLH